MRIFFSYFCSIIMSSEPNLYPAKLFQAVEITFSTGSVEAAVCQPQGSSDSFKRYPFGDLYICESWRWVRAER